MRSVAVVVTASYPAPTKKLTGTSIPRSWTQPTPLLEAWGRLSNLSSGPSHIPESADQGGIARSIYGYLFAARKRRRSALCLKYFIIASERGVELGFAASIPEDDYFDVNVKDRNRAIVPLINSKLPDPTDPTTVALDAVLTREGGWHFNSKTRLSPGSGGYDRFSSAAALFAHVKTAGVTTGGGCICRQIATVELPALNLAVEFERALSNFLPLIVSCLPSSWDADIRRSQAELDSLSKGVSFDPDDIDDGRKKILTQLAVRQGQHRFRSDLLDAYKGRCAISGTAVADALHAAHISPYMGPATNHVVNGLLLRADVHNLFDLKLIKIDPISLTVVVSDALAGTEYERLHGKLILVPSDITKRPSREALAKHFDNSQIALEPA